MKKEKCVDCKKPYPFGVDVFLPHSQWSLIAPEKDIILCANCIANRVGNLKGAILIHATVEFSPLKDDYKEKYEKCINVIKRFDAGIIGMYDL